MHTGSISVRLQKSHYQSLIAAPFPTCSWSLEQGHVSPYNHTKHLKSQNLAPKKIDVGLRYILPLNGKDLAIQSNHHSSNTPSHPFTTSPMRLCHLKGKVKGEHFPYRCGIAQSTGLRTKTRMSRPGSIGSIGSRPCFSKKIRKSASSTAFTQEVTWHLHFT